MSYILSALKKAEQARDGQADTALTATPAQGAPGAAAASSRLPWLALLAVLAVMIALLLMAIVQGNGIELSGTPSATQSTPVADAARAAEPQVGPVASSSSPASVSPMVPVQTPDYSASLPAQSQPAQSPQRQSPASANELASTASMPESLPALPATPNTAPPTHATRVAEQAVAAPPTLNITGYIFFENSPAASKLFVDGIVYRHGSSLGDGMIIRAFKPDRVVVSRRGAVQEVLIP